MKKINIIFIIIIISIVATTSFAYDLYSDPKVTDSYGNVITDRWGEPITRSLTGNLYHNNGITRVKDNEPLYKDGGIIKVRPNERLYEEDSCIGFKRYDKRYND